RRLRTPIRDVVPDGRSEQERILQHYANIPAQRFNRHRTDVHAVNRHATLGHVIKPWQKVEECRFTTAGRPEETARVPIVTRTPSVRTGAASCARYWTNATSVPIERAPPITSWPPYSRI